LSGWIGACGSSSFFFFVVVVVFDRLVNRLPAFEGEGVREGAFRVARFKIIIKSNV
jgi:hypothetical protein